MEIKVLGTGCAKCKSLEKSVKEAVAQLNFDASVEKVEDIVKIMQFGVMMTPALVINSRVIFSGKVPSVEELKKLIVENQ